MKLKSVTDRQLFLLAKEFLNEVWVPDRLVKTILVKYKPWTGKKLTNAEKWRMIKKTPEYTAMLIVFGERETIRRVKYIANEFTETLK